MNRDTIKYFFIDHWKKITAGVLALLVMALAVTGMQVYSKKQTADEIKAKNEQTVKRFDNHEKIQSLKKDEAKYKQLNKHKGKGSKNDSISTGNKAVATSDIFGFDDEVYTQHQSIERAGIEEIKNFMAKKDYDSIVNDYGTGSITIPSINITLPIIEGTTNSHLWVGATTFYKDQTLKRGNYPLFSHNTGYSQMLFTDLGKVNAGDKVQVVSYADGYKQVVDYKVTNVQTVDYRKVDVLKNTPDRTLTLITCATATPSFERTVVTAKPV